MKNDKLGDTGNERVGYNTRHTTSGGANDVMLLVRVGVGELGQAPAHGMTD